jgi:biotin-(acetyl-CoA carboxylase) ligase
VEHPDKVIARWQELSTWAFGRPVRIISSEDEFEGVTRGLTSSGALVLEMDSGAVRHISSGEISLRSPNQIGGKTFVES